MSRFLRILVLVLIFGLIGLPGLSARTVGVPSDGIETPDEEDFVDLLMDFVPEDPATGGIFDLGQVNDIAESIVPGIIDEYPDLTFGNGCSLGTSGPSLRRDGLTLRGSASWSCGNEQTALAIVVCIQFRGANRWKEMEGSCRSKEAHNQPGISKKTSAICRPGTWKYRMIAAAASSGSGGSNSQGTRTGPPQQISCRRFL
jgi:hypothetical protein